MTPSDCYKDALDRGAKHDQMQYDVLQWLKEHDEHNVWCYGEEHEDYPVRAEIEPERMFYSRDGRMRTFADICERYRSARRRNDILLVVYEIKPKIETVFGLKRQCAAQYADLMYSYSDTQPGALPELYSFPVVPADDPKLPMLCNVMGDRVLVWDGKCLMKAN